MYLLISGCFAALALCGFVLAAKYQRRARTLQNQLLAFHEVGAEQDKRLAAREREVLALSQERDKWRAAAEQSRLNALLEVQNLLTYNGSAEGQHEFEQ